MHTTAHSDHSARPVHPVNPLPWLLGILALLLALFAWQHLAQQTADHQLRMEKSSGRNGQHANQKAKENAAEEYEKAKAEFEKLKSKPGKSKEDAELRNKLKKQLEHWRKKKDWKGENHSQTPKGN